MIQFGPLIFSPVKGKRNKQFLKRNTGSNEMFVFFFEMETGHMVTQMVFHAVTADQNARISARRVSGKSVSFRRKQTTAKINQRKRIIGSLTLDSSLAQDI